MRWLPICMPGVSWKLFKKAKILNYENVVYDGNVDRPQICRVILFAKQASKLPIASSVMFLNMCREENQFLFCLFVLDPLYDYK